MRRLKIMQLETPKFEQVPDRCVINRSSTYFVHHVAFSIKMPCQISPSGPRGETMRHSAQALRTRSQERYFFVHLGVRHTSTD